MAYEITNVRKGSSVIRCEGAGTYTITLNDLSTNTSLETVSTASIKRVLWSTGGTVAVARGATPNTVITLYGNGEMRYDEMGHALANGSSGDIVITIGTGGSCFLEVSKTATFTSDPNLL